MESRLDQIVFERNCQKMLGVIFVSLRSTGTTAEVWDVCANRCSSVKSVSVVSERYDLCMRKTCFQHFVESSIKVTVKRENTGFYFLSVGILPATTRFDDDDDCSYTRWGLALWSDSTGA